MIKRKKIRVWQGNPELYKQHSKIDYFATEDEVTKGFAFYQRNSNGELILKGSSSRFDFQKEMKEMVPNIRPVRIDAYTGNLNEFKPGKGKLFVSGDGSVITDNQPRKFCYVYHDSTGTIEKVEISKDMTSRNFVGVASPGTIYGGYYVTDIDPDGDTSGLDEYSASTAATEACTIEKDKVYYVHEIPVPDPLEVVYGEDFTYTIWLDPTDNLFSNPKVQFQGMLGNKLFIPELVDEMTYSRAAPAQKTEGAGANPGYKIYLFKGQYLCSPESLSHGITITLLDGTTVVVPVEDEKNATEKEFYYLDE